MASNKIWLTSDGEYEEATAYEDILPGSIIDLRTDGEVELSDADGNQCEILLAVEDSLQGRDVTVAYDASADDIVRFVIPEIGTRGQVLLAAGEEAVIGDYLTVGTGGECRVAVTSGSNGIGDDKVYFRVLEALDLSEEDTAALIKVRRC